ncbi:hypothetical protein PFBG_06009 [Plasmodium falciparum 7G8]|uniref:Uncharacterized protein n=1 Tax=Plasmodium falciparum (isolate 7G8) TaxID=57266 RepID=W7ESW7_PLAF8|nr:hypothetical protein PFBG_06009 [Plasmodium falciparum 7G8]
MQFNICIWVYKTLIINKEKKKKKNQEENEEKKKKEKKEHSNIFFNNKEGEIYCDDEKCYLINKENKNILLKKRDNKEIKENINVADTMSSSDMNNTMKNVINDDHINNHYKTMQENKSVNNFEGELKNDHLQISKDNQNDNNNFICYNNKYNSVCKIKTENSLLENNSNENKSETDNENSDKKINNKMNDSTIENVKYKDDLDNKDNVVNDIKGEDVKYKDDFYNKDNVNYEEKNNHLSECVNKTQNEYPVEEHTSNEVEKNKKDIDSTNKTKYPSNRNYYSDNYINYDTDENSNISSSKENDISDEYSSYNNDSLYNSDNSEVEKMSSSMDEDELDEYDDDDDDDGEDEEEEENSDEDKYNDTYYNNDNNNNNSDKFVEGDNQKHIQDDILNKSVEEIKDIGNNYFKNNDYLNAIYYYNKALKKCKDKNIKSILYSNRAACNIFLKKWNTVIEDCNKSIHLNDNFAKSYIRRSNAYEQLQKYNDASNDLNKALTIDPNLLKNYQVKQRKLKELAEQQLNKEKEEMVGKLKDFGNLLLGKVGLSLDNFEVQKNPNNDGSFNIQFKQNK